MDLHELLTGGRRKWLVEPPASEESLRELLASSGLRLPEDYLDVLRISNGGQGKRAEYPRLVRLWQAEDVRQQQADYEMAENVPGFFAIGDLGGDSFIAYDARVDGPWPLYTIPYGPMSEDEARRVAGSLTELLEGLEEAGE